MATTTIGPLIPVAANPRSQNGSQRFPADHPILSFLDEHNTLTTADLKRIHARMLRFDLLRHPYAASRLLTSFALSPSRNLPYALRLFDQIPHPNLYSWNILIRSLASSPLPYLSLHLFSRMLTSSPHSPDRFTFPFVIKAAAELEMLGEGSALHGLVIKSPFHSDVFILNSLVHFYAVCGCLDLSRQVFDFIPQKDVVSWNSMITALVRADRCNDALELFKAMEQSGFAPNDVTMVSLLSACGKKGNLELGWWMHSYIKQNGIKQCLILNNAILDMYAKCGSSADASLLFNSMKKKDSISWTTMLVAYAKSFEFDAARRVFDEMPHRDTAVWNALISGYEQNGRPKDALAAFNELRDVAKLEPDELTFVAALSACSQLCALESGLAMHGRGMEAMDLFKEMQVAKVKPNHVTFTNILSACSHAGLVEEGRMYFTKMLPLYGIAPQIEHYGCMADILGRAGRLEEARELIKSMPFQPPASAWGALLGACVVHGDVLLGELACHKLLELEPRNDGAYVLLSNLYAKAGRWEDVGRLRKSMRDQGLKKEPGCSSMEVDGVIHEFLVGDASHPLSERIYKKLEEMTERLKAVGYEANRTQLLQNVEDEVGKEHALSLHSEKLAIAYGLISVRETMAIRINKNLRICEDCHSVGKLISDVYGREILIRDRYRFHHFKQGRCSCKDYW
ncbi:pentatricopeptide repeat-containing protein At2g29760, chloroplastic isoform X3 [Phalaenopsis equestris]|uniref:pentatricopeptide repeat-containing protein At2g29760, chloroplastic isoform X3 n=1 Tax=Phalaenopsis equestris TaxID=78828 RepID=UPI0009E2F51A|nr:pentatricopeptide repeat-containing protein At2g29760, chloroplastic isoform X3 [Phalaenopsis equestris]